MRAARHLAFLALTAIVGCGSTRTYDGDAARTARLAYDPLADAKVGDWCVLEGESVTEWPGAKAVGTFTLLYRVAEVRASSVAIVRRRTIANGEGQETTQTIARGAPRLLDLFGVDPGDASLEAPSVSLGVTSSKASLESLGRAWETARIGFTVSAGGKRFESVADLCSEVPVLGVARLREDAPGPFREDASGPWAKARTITTFEIEGYGHEDSVTAGRSIEAVLAEAKKRNEERHRALTRD